MQAIQGCLDLLFGRGDDGFPFWLLVVRLNILTFLLASGFGLYHLTRIAPPRRWLSPRQAATLSGLVVLAAALRFLVEANLTALGGIGYSRILLGYRGHFGTAQLYSPLYQLLGRDLDVAISLNRVASTATVAIVYLLGTRLLPHRPSFAAIAALLLALHPLHLLFTPTDGLPISSSFLAAASYLFLAVATRAQALPLRGRSLLFVAAACGLTLLTQIRYENVLLLVPSGLYLLLQRHRLAAAWTAPGIAVGCSFLAVYLNGGLASAPAHPSVISLTEGLRQAGEQLLGNPIYTSVPLLIGVVAAIASPRSRIRTFAALPVLALLPVVASAIALEAHDYSIGFVGLARPFVNLLLPLALVAAHGLALLWTSTWRLARLIPLATLAGVAATALLYVPNLSTRYAELAEHEFLTRFLSESDLTGIDRLIVPDDEILFRESHSSIELLQKYRLISFASTGGRLRVVGTTEAAEHPQANACDNGNCLFFSGLPCSHIRHYWFARTHCAAWSQRLDRALASEEVFAGSFLDCSLDYGAARDRACGRSLGAHRFAIYRVQPAPAPTTDSP